jgi:hypothetical protein
MSLDEIICTGNPFIFLYICLPLLFDEQEKEDWLCGFEWSM